MARRRDLAREEDGLRSQVTGLPAEQRRHYYEIESEGIRDPDTYAALNYLIVGGLHHFYLGKVMYGVINLTLTVIGAVLIVIFYHDDSWPLGFFIIGFVVLIELPQLFRSQTIVEKHNILVMKNSLEETRHHFADQEGSNTEQILRREESEDMSDSVRP